MFEYIVIGLLVLLIGAILFREQLREIVGIVVPIFVAYSLWDSNKPIAIGIIAFVIVLYGAGILLNILNNKLSILKNEMEQLESDMNLQYQTQPQTVQLPEGWYFTVSRQRYGPVTEQELLNSRKTSKIPPDTPICFSAANNWSPANKIWAGRF